MSEKGILFVVYSVLDPALVTRNGAVQTHDGLGHFERNTDSCHPCGCVPVDCP